MLGFGLRCPSLLPSFYLPLKLAQRSSWVVNSSGQILRNQCQPLTAFHLLLSQAPLILTQPSDLMLHTWALASNRRSAFLYHFSLCSRACLLGTSKAGRSPALHLFPDRMQHTNARSQGACNCRYGLFMSGMKVGEQLQLPGKR